MKRILSEKAISITVLALVGICLPLLTGCQARACKMTPEHYEIMKQLPYSVSVNETSTETHTYEGVAGTDVNTRWGTEISMIEFTWALQDALKKSSVFETVANNDTSDYVLHVAILDYNKPWYGSSMTVRLETEWTLLDAKTDKVVWQNTFASAYKTGWITSIGSITDRGRLQQAQEGAARANIKEGIRRLSILEL